MALEKQM